MTEIPTLVDSIGVIIHKINVPNVKKTQALAEGDSSKGEDEGREEEDERNWKGKGKIKRRRVICLDEIENPDNKSR